jgi:hypothetical protein
MLFPSRQSFFLALLSLCELENTWAACIYRANLISVSILAWVLQLAPFSSVQCRNSLAVGLCTLGRTSALLVRYCALLSLLNRCLKILSFLHRLCIWRIGSAKRADSYYIAIL